MLQLHVLLLVLQGGRRGYVLRRLVRELEILLERDRVLDLEEHDGGGEDEGSRQKAPLPAR